MYVEKENYVISSLYASHKALAIHDEGLLLSENVPLFLPRDTLDLKCYSGRKNRDTRRHGLKRI